MTSTQISYIVENLLDDVTDSETYLEKCDYIILSKQDRIVIGPNKKLYFDMSNKLLIVTDLNEKGEEVVYSDNIISRCYYTFDSILLFVMKLEVE